MIIHVKLFGLYPIPIKGYDSLHGLKMELPAQATVNDLLRTLNIKELEAGIVVSECRVLTRNAPLEDGMELSICRAVSGG